MNKKTTQIGDHYSDICLSQKSFRTNSNHHLSPNIDSTIMSIPASISSNLIFFFEGHPYVHAQESFINEFSEILRVSLPDYFIRSIL